MNIQKLMLKLILIQPIIYLYNGSAFDDYQISDIKIKYLKMKNNKWNH